MLRRRLVRTPAHPSSVPAVRPVRPTSGGPARRPIWPSLEMDEVDHENAEGAKSHRYWRVIAVDAPHSLEVQDGFADDTGAPNPDLPTTTVRVVLCEEGGVTQVITTSTFPSREAMEQLVNMGMEDGLRAAMAQMDEILTARARPAGGP